MIEIVVQNRQRTHPLRSGEVKAFLRDLIALQPPGKADALTVRIVSDARMQEFNRTYRGRDETTDVLAFPSEGEPGPDGSRYLGDIVISADRAASQAAELGHHLSLEVKVLVLHGYLHLLGYDHERDAGEMLRLQKRLLRSLQGGRGIGR